MQIRDNILARLTAYQGWALGSAVPNVMTLFDYLGFVGTPALLFGFAMLFWPEIVQHDGLRFRALGFSVESYERWKLG
jgi:hypothetical protein